MRHGAALHIEGARRLGALGPPTAAKCLDNVAAHGSCILCCRLHSEACSSNRDVRQQVTVACAAHASVCQASFDRLLKVRFVQTGRIGVQRASHSLPPHLPACGGECSCVALVKGCRHRLPLPVHAKASHLVIAVSKLSSCAARRTRTCLQWRWWTSGERAAASLAAGARASAASAPMWRTRSSAGGLGSVSFRWPGTLVGSLRARVQGCGGCGVPRAA